MPITDPIPDEAIVEGFKLLRDHQTDDLKEGHGHGHHPHQPSKPPPPPRVFLNEEPKDDHILHDGSLPDSTGVKAGGTGAYHQNPKNGAEFVSLKERNHIPPTSTPPSHSPFPDIDVYLLNPSQKQTDPIQTQGQGVGGAETLPPGQLSIPHPENPNSAPDNKSDSNYSKPTTTSEGHHHSGPKHTDMIMVPVGHLGNHSYRHNKHGDELNEQNEDLEMNATATGGGTKRGTNSKEVLERAIIAQWPPPDQVNHIRVDAYERTGRDSGGGEELVEQEGTKVKKWFRPSAWMDRKYYKVSLNLKNDWRRQASFFAKVILIKATQLLLINSWILLVGLNLEIRTVVVEHYDWMFLPLGIFLLILILVRVVAKSKAGWLLFISFFALILMTALIAYPLAAVTFAYGAYCIPMVTLTLFLTCLTLPFVPYMTQSPATKPIIARIGAVLVMIYSVFIMMVVAYSKLIPDMAHFSTHIWCPGFLMAELVLWGTIFEIRRVLEGYCFNVSEHRWCFTALYT